MRQSLRISNKFKNLMLYLCDNLKFIICYIILMEIIFIWSIFSNNKIFNYLFCIMMEGFFIISTIRITDKITIKRNKLRHVIFSNIAPIVYLLILLVTYIDISVYNIIAYLFNFSLDIEKNGKYIFLFIIVYVISMLISIILSILIAKKYKKKLIRKSDNDVKILCK